MLKTITLVICAVLITANICHSQDTITGLISCLGKRKQPPPNVWGDLDKSLLKNNELKILKQAQIIRDKREPAMADSRQKQALELLSSIASLLPKPGTVNTAELPTMTTNDVNKLKSIESSLKKMKECGSFMENTSYDKVAAICFAIDEKDPDAKKTLENCRFIDDVEELIKAGNSKKLKEAAESSKQLLQLIKNKLEEMG